VYIHQPQAPVLVVEGDDFDAGVQAAVKEAHLRTYKDTLKEKL